VNLVIDRCTVREDRADDVGDGLTRSLKELPREYF
jgi:hypothetical protein